MPHTTITPPATTPPTPLARSTPGGSKSAAPTPHRWTIAEYRELFKTGLFYDKKTMLLDGVLYVMVMPNPPHDTVLTLTYEFLRSAFPTGHVVRNQQGFDVGTHNDPSPDLAVVTGAIRDYATRTPTTAVLVVEVADSSLFMDTTTKAELYATAGVKDYWVIDLQNRQVLVFRDPVALPAGLGATAYRTHFSLNPSDTVAPLAVPNATVQVADLLP